MRSLSAAEPSRDHPALARRELLVGVEAEDGRVPARADRGAVGVHGAERLAGVLDDRQAEALERREVGRVAEDVDRQQRRRALGDRRGRGLRVDVQRHRVDVREDGPRALEQADVGAGDERERRRHDLAAVLHAGGAQRQVKPGRAARDCARVGDAEPLGEGRSNSGTRGPSESWPDRRTSATAALLGVAEDRPRQRDLVGGRRARRRSRARARAQPLGLRGRGRPAAPRLLGVLQRVDERLPRGGDHVLGDADRAPHVLAVGGVDQHARGRRRVPCVSSRIRTLKLTSSMSARCGWISLIAARSAASSALTGPLPSAVRT